MSIPPSVNLSGVTLIEKGAVFMLVKINSAHGKSWFFFSNFGNYSRFVVWLWAKTEPRRTKLRFSGFPPLSRYERTPHRLVRPSALGPSHRPWSVPPSSALGPSHHPRSVSRTSVHPSALSSSLHSQSIPRPSVQPSVLDPQSIPRFTNPSSGRLSALGICPSLSIGFLLLPYRVTSSDRRCVQTTLH